MRAPAGAAAKTRCVGTAVPQTWNVVAGRTDPAYWNVHGPFGGWIASQLLDAVLREPARRGDPIATSTSFVGAIEAGPFAIHLRRLRTNRSTDFWWSELRQEQNGEEQVCAYATVALAQRPPTPTLLEHVMPDAPDAAAVEARTPPLPLAWFERFELRPTDEKMFLGESARSLTWTRKTGVALDFSTLTEICDSAAPRIFARTRRPVPIATVTMNVFFHATAAEIAETGNGFVLCDANWHGANDGYFDEQQLIWSESGRLLAATDQLCWYRLPAEGANGSETRR